MAVAVYNHYMRIAHEGRRRKREAEAAEVAAASAAAGAAAQRPGSLTERLEVRWVPWQRASTLCKVRLGLSDETY